MCNRVAMRTRCKDLVEEGDGGVDVLDIIVIIPLKARMREVCESH
jgi:hypothetical protein